MRYFPLLLLLVVEFGCRRSTQHYIDRGNEFFQAKRYKDAEINYQKAISRDRNSGEAYYKMALIRLEERNLVDAHSALKKAVELLPNRADIRVKEGDVALRLFAATGRTIAALYHEAEKAAAEVLKRDPASAYGLGLQGDIAILANKPNDAIAAFRNALKQRPEEPEFRMGLVQAYFLNQQFREGEVEALECIKAHPSYGRAYRYLDDYYLARARTTELEELLKRHVTNAPKELQPRLRLALHHLQSKNVAASDAVLQTVLEDTAAFPDGNLAVGDFHRRSGRMDEALKRYETGARAADGRRSEYLRRLAETRWATGNIEQALRDADAAVAANTDDQAAVALKAQMLIATGRPDSVRQGIDNLQAIIQKDPSDVAIRQQLAAAYATSGRYTDARTQLTEALRRQAGDVISLLSLGAVSQALGQYNDMVRYASEVLKHQPSHVPARLLLASGLIATGRQAEARPDLTSLVKEQPQYTAAALQLALLNTSEKRYREAHALLQRLYQPGQSDVQIIRAIAGLYAAEKQFDRAAKVLEDESRSHPQLRTMLATIEAAAGRYDKAIAVLQADKSRSPETYVQLVSLHRQKKDLSGAAVVVEQALREFPKDVRVAREAVIVYESRQDRTNAHAAHRRLLELAPDDAEAKNNVAYVLADTGGDLNQALQLAQAAVKQQPQSAAFADTLAWIHFKRGDKDTAVQMLQKLVQRYPENAYFREHLQEVQGHRR